MATSNRKAFRSSKVTNITPLGIIATFVALSETVAGLAAVKTVGTVQLLFAAFAVLFPVFVASLFFAVLWKRSYVFYPPQDFGREVDVTTYVDAMRHQVMGNQELLALVRTSISETFKSNEAQKALARVTAEESTSNEQALKTATAEIVERTVNRIEESVLIVDISEFEYSAGPTPELIFRYDPQQDAFSLLSAIYSQIAYHVPAFTYGQVWALKDSKTNQLILPANVNWADNYALANSGATVAQLGLRAGMRLYATRIS